MSLFAPPYSFLVGALALAALVGSALYFERINPKNEIRAHLKEKYFSTDTTFGYRPRDFYAMLAEYDKGGRQDFEAHDRFISLDLYYPLFYALSAAALIACLHPLYEPLDHGRSHFLWLLPFGAMLFDYAENLSMRHVIRHTRTTPSAWLTFSSLMTSLKLLFFYAFAFLLALGLLLCVKEVAKLIYAKAT